MASKETTIKAEDIEIMSMEESIKFLDKINTYSGGSKVENKITDNINEWDHYWNQNFLGTPGNEPVTAGYILTDNSDKLYNTLVNYLSTVAPRSKPDVVTKVNRTRVGLVMHDSLEKTLEALWGLELGDHDHAYMYSNEKNAVGRDIRQMRLDISDLKVDFKKY